MFPNLPGAAKAPLMRAAASTSMKPGRVKGQSGVDWFTLLFEFPRITWMKTFVVSFNGATKLILSHKVLLRLLTLSSG